MANYCHNCGAKLKANAKFCNVCGTKTFSENNSAPVTSENKSAPITLEKKSSATSGESLQERYLRLKVQQAENISAPITLEKKSAPMSVQEIMENAKKNSAPTNPQPAQNNQAQNFSNHTAPQNVQNNYSAPQQNYNPLGAVTPHTPDENFHDLFFKRDGRLNRLRFFKRTMLASLIACLPGVLYIILTDNPEIYYETSKTMILLQLTLIIINVCLTYNLIIRRCHDLSIQGWWAKRVAENENFFAYGYVAFAVMSAISAMGNLSHDPGVVGEGVIWLYLCFAKGEVGPNKYGADPLENVR